MPYDFDYYQPTSAAEAVRLFDDLDRQGKAPLYYGGGTEILTFGRLNLVETGSVIDIKGLPECRRLALQGGELHLGAGLSLTELEEANPFALLSRTAGEIADRTARNKITLGGNLCGKLFYREAVLPFLLTDSQAVLAGRYGWRRVSLHEVFHGSLRLSKGEFLGYLVTQQAYLALPHISVKIRKQWKTGYPLLTAAALRVGGTVRVAFSGLCPFPFRSVEVEQSLNNRSLPLAERIESAVQRMPSPILQDVEGTAAYRLFVLRNLLGDILAELAER